MSKKIKIIGPNRQIVDETDRSTARELVAQGKAEWWSSGREIRLIREPLRAGSAECLPESHPLVVAHRAASAGRAEVDDEAFHEAKCDVDRWEAVLAVA